MSELKEILLAVKDGGYPVITLSILFLFMKFIEKLIDNFRKDNQELKETIMDLALKIGENNTNLNKSNSLLEKIDRKFELDSQISKKK